MASASTARHRQPGAESALRVRPNLLRDLDEPGDLDPLVRFRQIVAVRGGGKAALVTERALLQRDVARGLVDAALDFVLAFGRRVLRTHQPDHDRDALRREAERREIARALVVVFEEEAVDLHLVEQNFRDRLITALRDPGALEISAAQMHRNRHVLRPIADRVVDQLAVKPDERVGIVAARDRALANGGIAEIGQIGVVELQVAAAARGEIRDLGAISGAKVFVEVLQPGIDAGADRFAAAAEMQHRGRGNADFCRTRGDAFEKVEIRALNRSDMPDLALDMHRRRLETDLRPIVLAELGDELAIMGTDAFEPFEEIDVEIGAAEFAVRYPLQPCPLLTLDHLPYAFNLNASQIGRAQIPGEEFLPRLQQMARPQEAPDMVGAKRRHGSSR